MQNKTPLPPLPPLPPQETLEEKGSSMINVGLDHQSISAESVNGKYQITIGCEGDPPQSILLTRAQFISFIALSAALVAPRLDSIPPPLL